MSTSHYVIDPLAVNPVDRSVTKLRYVSVTRYSPEWHSIFHTHSCAEVFYVTGGSGRLLLADKAVSIGINDVLIVNSSVEHTEDSSEDDPLEYIVMGVDGMEVISGECSRLFPWCFHLSLWFLIFCFLRQCFSV